MPDAIEIMPHNGGTLTEAEMLTLCNLLVKAGYRVRIDRKLTVKNTRAKYIKAEE